MPGKYVEAALADLDSTGMVYLGKGRLIVTGTDGELWQVDPKNPSEAKEIDRVRVVAIAADEAISLRE